MDIMRSNYHGAESGLGDLSCRGDRATQEAKVKKRKARRRAGQRHAAQEPQDVSLARWDQGATGPANRRGLVTEDRGDIDPDTGKRTNPNGVRGVRRVDMLEFWHRNGVITTEGYNAAEKLMDAYEETQRGQSWPSGERVQSTAKPGAFVEIQISRISAYHAIAQHVTADDWRIVSACVMGQQTPEAVGYKGKRYKDGLAHLRAALERLAARLSGR